MHIRKGGHDIVSDIRADTMALLFQATRGGTCTIIVILSSAPGTLHWMSAKFAN